MASSISQDHQAEQRRLDKDRTRELNHRHKWAFGDAEPTKGHPTRRPSKPIGGPPPFYYHPARKNDAVKNNEEVANERYIFHQVDSDTEHTLSAESGPEEDYTYSFDAPTGPNSGAHVLGHAIAKAEEKFETKVTEKLVKDEYEVVRHDQDVDRLGETADDEFELI